MAFRRSGAKAVFCRSKVGFPTPQRATHTTQGMHGEEQPGTGLPWLARVQAESGDLESAGWLNWGKSGRIGPSGAPRGVLKVAGQR